MFTPETAVPLDRTWGGFEVATWDDPALDRLIVHDENTIQVLNVSGALIEQISGFTAPIRCIEPWQFRSSNESRIATVTWNDSTPDGKLWVHGPGGYIEPTIPLGGIRTYELYAGDYSQNGHDDLFLVSAWDAVLIWLFNSGGPDASTNTTFSTTDDGRAYSEPFSLHPLIGIGNQYGGGATGDVDNDGDIDFLLACDRTHDVHIKRNTLFHEVTRMVPHVVASSYYRVNPLIPAGIATGTYNAHGGELSLWFELPADGAGSHTHVQHTLYQIGDLDPERVVASELLLLSALSPLDPNAPPHQAPLIGNSSSAPILTSAAYRSTTATTDRASYRLHTRLVTLDSGVITASTPESTFEFVHDRTFSAGWSPTAVPDTGNPGPPTPAADPNEVPPPRVPPTPPPGGN